MKEENGNPSEKKGGKQSKYENQNQAPSKGNILKPKSSWGSNIVKGFTADKKIKQQQIITTTIRNPKVTNNSQSRAKRSLITDLSGSAQVHPASHRRQSSSGSRDLFNELDQLRNLLQESKEREFKLQAELSAYKRNPKVLDLERELEGKKNEVEELNVRVGLLENEKTSLLSGLSRDHHGNEGLAANSVSSNPEMEVVELRRLNKELQMQKRNLSCKLASMESQLASLAKESESNNVSMIKAEVSTLRHTNEDLCKQVEGLQMSRLNEVEELAYLRWVNSCLRDELAMNSEKELSPRLTEENCEPIDSFSSRTIKYPEYSGGKSLSLIKKLKKWPITSEDVETFESPDSLTDKTVIWEEERSPRRRHSISGSKLCIDDFVVNKRRQSDVFVPVKDMEKEEECITSHKYNSEIDHNHEPCRIAISFDVEKRALRIPNPPPRPSCSISKGPKEIDSNQMPPPPPPPPPLPPKFSAKSSACAVQRAPQVVEFYHSLMKRDSRKDSSNGGVCEALDVSNVRSNMIGEIENRSSYLLAIKADVETQGEFVNSLIREVNGAIYHDIEDVVAFVKWLDDELCFLVDERAVLKHFNWPEKKADTLREAAFGYRDLKKLESEICHYEDNPRTPCDIALKKMVAISEKMERTVYNLHRTRDSLMRNCKEFKIPTEWMLDNGIISKIKLGSVKLAKKYMRRVAMELQLKAGLEKDPAMDYMLLQGVRFAFRIHQFAGGFDAETMHAFEELRNLAHLLNKK
ncbi:protein CHUP1, chloroplastic-like [Rutidosis leptorrhynchoides]|uniref:protein CHUP1, chloroplastic-like n=1 Tax=Rutidosis leptorrhynchoides TaxID=125765 RepID=UPI003A999B00